MSKGLKSIALKDADKLWQLIKMLELTPLEKHTLEVQFKEMRGWVASIEEKE